jgi:uncharacterized membrane protein YgdD (TMEM256/DUF423 family)
MESVNMLLVRIAAVSGFLAVALGAFGAHALRGLLDPRGLASAWEKAVLYQLAHSVALLALGSSGNIARAPAWLFVAGITLFSGSLYLMCLTNVRAVGAITPLGGLCFLTGWVWLVFSPSH